MDKLKPRKLIQKTEKESSPKQTKELILKDKPKEKEKEKSKPSKKMNSLERRVSPPPTSYTSKIT
jgi:hypothetical protein